mmetsp:Transcript_111180/g.270165  ORF Transcript_111180/g.270165 Transcript_111180/m.270165 type:complete len:231 (-) Transcript_111180:212-904(-)
MWGDAHVECGEAGVEAHRSALLHDFHRAIHGALVHQFPCLRVWLLLLHLGLDKIKGQREEGCEEASDGRGAKDLRCASDAHAGKGILAGSVEGEHAEVQGHSPLSCRPSAGHQAHGALLLHNQAHGRCNIGVTCSLRCWQHAVCLHADEGKVCRITQKGSKTTGTQRGQCILAKAHLLPRRLQHRGELVKEAQAGAGVDHLASKASSETSVERRNAFVLQHVARNRHRAG